MANQEISVLVDDVVLENFPEGSKVVRAVRHGYSDWSALTARLVVEEPGGRMTEFFLKVLEGVDAEARALGEYTSMTTLHQAVPTLVPRPKGYGKYHSLEYDDNNNKKSRYYFLNEFKQIHIHGEEGEDSLLPDPVSLGRRIAHLHSITNGQSPHERGMFGCDPNRVPFDGKLPLLGGWDKSWMAYFTRLLGLSYSHARVLHGSSSSDNDESSLGAVFQKTTSHLIPRLLGPLEDTISPCLIHGDLWESNIGTDRATGAIYIFDAAAYRAHNEKELGIWMCEHHSMHARFDEYAREYWKAYGCGEQGPDGEWRDRVRLYSTQTMLMRCGSVEDWDVWKSVGRIWEELLEKYVPEKAGGEIVASV